MNPPIEGFEEDDSIQNVWLIDALQTCCFNRKTGLLTVNCDGRIGSIYFHVGVVVHAEAPPLSGEEAFQEMLHWNAATCNLEENITSDSLTMSTGWEELLREWTRYQKEEGRAEQLDLRMEAQAGFLEGKMVGPYLIRRNISSDSWGTLYEALQIAVNRTVALRVLNPAYYDRKDQVQQFISEASAMARVNNPFITAVYETGENQHLIYYTGEYFVGLDLKEHVEKIQFLTEDLALKIIINIGSALQYERLSNIPHFPLYLEQVLIPAKGAPKLLNNVALEGSAVSPSEGDEIQRMAEIIRFGLNPNEPVSPELQHLLNEMTRAEQAGFFWDTVVATAKQLELNRLAMRAVVTVTAGDSFETQYRKRTQRIWWVIACLFLLMIFGGVLYWYYYIKIPAGATKVDKMVYIEEGPFTYQNDEKLVLASFYIDQYEVTISQYQRFLDAWDKNRSSIREHPRSKSNKDHVPQEWAKIQLAIQNHGLMNGAYLYENSPVFNIDYYDAWAYAEWCGKRLPTEQEWEKAARGPKGNLYPWGNTPHPSYANTAADLSVNIMDPIFGSIDGFGLWAPVGAKPRDRSYFGIYDMAGNVCEWTSSLEINPSNPKSRNPVVRGGSWFSKDCRLDFRNIQESNFRRAQFIGFRCVSDKPVDPQSNSH